jgi:hypothetical protein
MTCHSQVKKVNYLEINTLNIDNDYISNYLEAVEHEV